jgi:hypothetical protein
VALFSAAHWAELMRIAGLRYRPDRIIYPSTTLRPFLREVTAHIADWWFYRLGVREDGE